MSATESYDDGSVFYYGINHLFYHYHKTGDATEIWKLIDAQLKSDNPVLPDCLIQFLGEKIDKILNVKSDSRRFPDKVVKAMGLEYKSLTRDREEEKNIRQACFDVNGFRHNQFSLDDALEIVGDHYGIGNSKLKKEYQKKYPSFYDSLSGGSPCCMTSAQDLFYIEKEIEKERRDNPPCIRLYDCAEYGEPSCDECDDYAEFW